MKHVKLIKIKTSNTFEIFQSLDIKFAFVKKIDGNTYKQISNPIKCRDFLGDCIWSKKTGKQASIYSFEYNYKTHPFDEDKLRLSLKFPDEESMENFKNNFDFIHTEEKINKISRSTYMETDDKSTLIVEASKVWQSNVWKISLYTFLLKRISYKTINDLQSPENEYNKVLTPIIIDKLMRKVKCFNKEPIADNIFSAHNYSGFVSICKNQNKEMCKLLLG